MMRLLRTVVLLSLLGVWEADGLSGLVMQGRVWGAEQPRAERARMAGAGNLRSCAGFVTSPCCSSAAPFLGSSRGGIGSSLDPLAVASGPNILRRCLHKPLRLRAQLQEPLMDMHLAAMMAAPQALDALAPFAAALVDSDTTGSHDVLQSELTELASLMQQVPLLAFQSYQTALEGNGFEADAATAAILYGLGKQISGWILKHPVSVAWIGRWMVIGWCDGGFAHYFYQWVDETVNSFGINSHVLEVLASVGFTAAIYTPVFALFFLGMVGFMENWRPLDAVSKVQSDFWQMCTGTWTIWSFFNVFLFGAVPVQQRTVVSMSMHFIYLLGLSTWEAGRQEVAEQIAELVDQASDPAFLTHVEITQPIELLEPVTVPISVYSLSESLSDAMGNAIDTMEDALPDALAEALETVENSLPEGFAEALENATPYSEDIVDPLGSSYMDLMLTLEPDSDHCTGKVEMKPAP